MLKWTACENLPADLDSCEPAATAAAAAAAAAADARYVTMLFNDETHTYDQVDIFLYFFAFSCRTRMPCSMQYQGF